MENMKRGDELAREKEKKGAQQKKEWKKNDAIDNFGRIKSIVGPK